MNVLVVSTGPEDPRTRIGIYQESGLFSQVHFVYLMECYGQEALPVETNDFLPVKDFLTPVERNKVFQKLKAKFNFDIVLHVDEFSLVTAARIREEFNLDDSLLSLDDAVKFRDKVLMKEALLRRSEALGIGVRIPKLYSKEDLLSGRYTLPVVVKPRSMAVATGVRVISQKEELDSLMQKFNGTTKEFEEMEEDALQCEEYITGDVYHIDGICKNGKVLFSVPSRYTDLPTCMHRGRPLGSIIQNSRSEAAAWNRFSQDVADLMDFPDGVFHLEAFRNADGNPVFLEVGARPGGPTLLK